MHVYIYICVCVYVYLYTYMYVQVYVYVYVYVQNYNELIQRYDIRIFRVLQHQTMMFWRVSSTFFCWQTWQLPSIQLPGIVQSSDEDLLGVCVVASRHRPFPMEMSNRKKRSVWHMYYKISYVSLYLSLSISDIYIYI